MLRFNLAASAVSVCLIAGCQMTPAPVNAPTLTAPAAQAPALQADAATVSLGEGTQVGVVSISPAKVYQALLAAAPTVTGSNPVHRWVAADVFQYNVVLEQSVAGAWVNRLSLVVSKTQTRAVFNQLAARQNYRALVTAMGNVGGTDATSTLNATAVVVPLDFTSDQNLNQTLAATVQVTLDNVAFSGDATVTVSAPADGNYNAPAGPVTGTPQP